MRISLNLFLSSYVKKAKVMAPSMSRERWSILLEGRENQNLWSGALFTFCLAEHAKPEHSHGEAEGEREVGWGERQ